MQILAVSGSLREASSNTTLLRALAALAPADTAVGFPVPLDSLPFFGKAALLPRLASSVLPALAARLPMALASVL